MTTIQDMVNREVPLMEVLITGGDVVLTFEEGQLRFVLTIIRSTPPKSYEIGMEVRDGMKWEKVERHGDILRIEREG